MLNGRRGVSACSLSSCRIRAEALARAFNTRLWHCSWLTQRSSAADDGMSNGIEDDEEFFDASPSPLEVEDDSSLCCQHHSSAATEAGRAKLYQLLQKHATDDAIDVFYDVSEDAGLTDSDTCFRDDAKEPIQVPFESSGCCRGPDDESVVDTDEGSCIDNIKLNELDFSGDNQSSDATITLETRSNQKSDATLKLITGDNNELQNGHDETQDVADPDISISQCSLETNYNDHRDNNQLNYEETNGQCDEYELKFVLQDCIITSPQDEKSVLNIEQERLCTVKGINDSNHEIFEVNEVAQVSDSPSSFYNDETKIVDEENSFNTGPAVSDDIPLPLDENRTIDINNSIDGIINDKSQETPEENGDTQVSDLPSSFSSGETEIVEEENSLISRQASSNAIPKSTDADRTLDINNDTNVSIEVTGTNSPSPTTSDAKNVSPTSSRLHVFDELRPKISRSTSLKTGKTPPGTPSRKKIVRFADVLGLDLEDVRHIMTGDIPIIPSSAYTDLNLKGIDLPTSEPISETVEIMSRQTTCWNSLQSITAANVLYPVFAIPGEQPDFLDRVRTQGICLETVIISDMSIQCTCRVMNYGYYKKVVARYTVNDWVSTNDIGALYVQGSSSVDMDKFGFSIFLSPSNREVKFALNYSVNGNEYWDNNGGQNYCLSYHGGDQLQQDSSTIWQHQFW